MMIHRVFADGNEVAAKSGLNKALSNFPDVCLSPPSPPAGPIPIPYPDFSFSKDLQKGSKKVKVKGKPAALKDQSFYKSSPLGDEAATRSFGANILTHQITGKTYFQMWSMDVKFEGKNVCRHIDITTSNHASKISTTGGVPTSESATTNGTDEEEACPCCEGPLHESQKGPDGKRAPPISQQDYYQSKKDAIDQKSAGFDKWAEQNPGRLSEQWPLKFGSKTIGPFTGTPAQIAKEEQRRAEEMLKELKELMENNKDCPNVFDPDDKCGTHLATPEGSAKAGRAEWEKSKKTYIRWAISNRPEWGVTKGMKINHITPLDAGGCPIGGKQSEGYPNLIPDGGLQPPCDRIDALQGDLQGRR